MVPKVWAVLAKRIFLSGKRGKVYEKTAPRRVPFSIKGASY